MMMPIPGGELRNGIGSVLSGRMLFMKICSPGEICHRMMAPAVGRGPDPASSKPFTHSCSSSFRDGRKDQTSDVQLHIGESRHWHRDSGFASATRSGMTPYELEQRTEAISSYPQKYALRLDLRAGTDCEQNTRSAFSWLADQPLRRPSAATFHCATLSEIMRVDLMAAWLSWA